MARQEMAAITRARERFAAGADTLNGVRPSIALSWMRCRDRYAVDPGLTLAPRAEGSSSESLKRNLDRTVVLTELGALAASVHTKLGSGVVTVVDGDGQIVGTWGDGVPGASEAHLAPWYSWSEATTGTNGMGTALESDGLTVVRGPEHWCEGFHSLDCLGIAIQDPVTHDAVAAVNVSTPTGTMPNVAPALLRSVSLMVSGMLEERARERGTDLAESFAAATAHKNRAVPTMALDLSGSVVVADDAAARLFGIPGDEPLIDPSRRFRLDLANLEDLVADAVVGARGSPDWTGTGQLLLPHEAKPVETTFTAVPSAGDPIGFLVSIGASTGEPLTTTSSREVRVPSTRVVARQRGGRTVLLHPNEIRYAQADGNTVWLDTDRGRLRAAERGLKNLEEQVHTHGFLRVHRRYLVNLSRVREVGRGADHELLLFLDSRHSTGAGARPVPVSRGHSRLVRTKLGL